MKERLAACQGRAWGQFWWHENSSGDMWHLSRLHVRLRLADSRFMDMKSHSRLPPSLPYVRGTPLLALLVWRHARQHEAEFDHGVLSFRFDIQQTVIANILSAWQGGGECTQAGTPLLKLGGFFVSQLLRSNLGGCCSSRKKMKVARVGRGQLMILTCFPFHSHPIPFRSFHSIPFYSIHSIPSIRVQSSPLHSVRWLVPEGYSSLSCQLLYSSLGGLSPEGYSSLGGVSPSCCCCIKLRPPHLF